MHSKSNERWFPYKGSNISYEYFHQNQSKPTLILLHGFLASKYCFHRMKNLLKDNYNILALDYPPFGNSDKQRKFVYSYENIANMIINLLNHLHIEKATFVGHSMGGQISLICAARYPERVEKLVLLSPSSYLKKSGKLMKLFSYLPFFTIFVKRSFYKKGVYNTLTQCVYDHSIIDKAMIQGYIKPFLKNDIYPCLAKMIRDREGDLSEELLHSIKHPCLILWGKEDEILPVRIGYQLVQDISNSTLRTFSEVGHFLPEEIPEQAVEEIKQFL